MNFEQAHENWIYEHLKKRKGERRGRLERGHGHSDQLFARNVWWRLKGNFNNLHPEYEVLDWRGRPYFADFAYILGYYLRLLIEIKDFGSHVREKDRQGHCNECNRETFLTGLGYTVISFAYDDVKERPELCANMLRLVLSRFESNAGPADRAKVFEQEIIRLSFTLSGEIRPLDVTRHLKINTRTAVRYLQSLCLQGWLAPVKPDGAQRVLRYRLVRGIVD
ncbi:hypothetical protein [Cohnella caldifontis]|uniref:hypothetical protein n=1 Tax=Cohnella caldifontis TaxID=3027471 RepID=UPI0023EDA941|nr:hypothetical protein [Cohnella sp. YIM B05605]